MRHSTTLFVLLERENGKCRKALCINADYIFSNMHKNYISDGNEMLGKFLYTKKKETEHHQKFACQSSENERPGREIRRAKCETGRVHIFAGLFIFLVQIGMMGARRMYTDGRI